MKKALMFILPIAFVLGIFLMVFFNRTSKSSNSVSLPPEVQPTQIPAVSPSPVLTGPLSEIDNDLRMIENDLKKVNEDPRFIPPEFIFSLGFPK